MTAVVDQSSGGSTTTTASTSHTVTLPGSMTSGDTALMAVGHGGTSTQSPSATGWTSLFDGYRSVGPGIFGMWRELDGTEGANVTVTTSASIQSAHNVWEISGADDPDTNPPEAGTVANGSSSTPDPPSLTAGGGSDDYLWFALCCFLDDNELTGAPTNYSNYEEISMATWGPYVSLGSGQRDLTAATENPGGFSASS